MDKAEDWGGGRLKNGWLVGKKEGSMERKWGLPEGDKEKIV